MWPFSKRKEPTRAETEAQLQAAAMQLPAKPLHKHQTAADQLDYWCKQHKATYEITRSTTAVVVRVHLPEGDTFAGKGETTMAAVVAVCKKLGAA
jgi:hypothetical protein